MGRSGMCVLERIGVRSRAVLVASCVGLGVEELVVDGLGGCAGRYAEFLAQGVVEVGVDAERFGGVSLGGECLHEELVAAFSERDESDELAAGTNGGRKFCPTGAEGGGGVGFEGAESDFGERAALFVDPGCVFAGKELSFGDEERGE